MCLIDEDRSATNFMIRDKMMKELIKKEPITPFTDRVNELYRKIEAEGLDILFFSHFITCQRFLDLPRKFELFIDTTTVSEF